MVMRALAALAVLLLPVAAHASIINPPGGATVSPAQINAAVTSQLNKPSGIAGLNAAGALTAPVDPATIQQTHNRSSPMSAKLADLLGDTVNVRSFASATSTGRVGGAVDTTTTAAVASGATTIPVAITDAATASLISSAKYIGIDGLGALPISSVSVSGSTATITLSSGVSAAIASGTAVSIAQQDDRPAFQAAGASLASSGGVAGTLEVPADHYMIVGDFVTIPDGASMVEHGGVVGAHGSVGAQATQHCNGCFWGGASGTVYAQSPTALDANAFTILQDVRSPPGRQVNSLLISTLLDTTAYDAGIVGEEIRLGIAPSIARGLLFGYHAVVNFDSGQYGDSSIAELEFQNNSGCDGGGDLGDTAPTSCDSGGGVKQGIHLDNIGSTNSTVGVTFGASSTGQWHIGLACPGAVLDWCIAAHYDGSSLKETAIDAGFKASGALLARGATITLDGHSANIPSGAPAADIVAPSYGIDTSFLNVYQVAKFTGGADFTYLGTDTTPTNRLWDASFGNWGAYANYLYVGHPINNATVTTANLPSGCTAGQSVFVSDARNSGEAAGAGTGALAYCTTAGKWYANGSQVEN
jgi:hypothetical protein